jgi:hypothetical protein
MGKCLHFNYLKPTNCRWAKEEADHGYRACYGTDDEGILIDL